MHPARCTCARCCRRLFRFERGLDSGEAARAMTFRALGHGARLKIVWLLARHGELCVRAFPRAVHISQPTVSHHLRILRNVGIVDVRRRGRRRYYALRRRRMTALLRHLARASDGPPPHSAPTAAR